MLQSGYSLKDDFYSWRLTAHRIHTKRGVLFTCLQGIVKSSKSFSKALSFLFISHFSKPIMYFFNKWTALKNKIYIGLVHRLQVMWNRDFMVEWEKVRNSGVPRLISPRCFLLLITVEKFVYSLLFNKCQG